MLTKKRILQIIQENSNVLKSYGVKSIGVFGSFGNSSANNKSDVDILVDFEKGKKLFDNYMELKFFLEGLLHRRVDLVIKGALKPEIKPYVIKNVHYA